MSWSCFVNYCLSCCFLNWNHRCKSYRFLNWIRYCRNYSLNWIRHCKSYCCFSGHSSCWNCWACCMSCYCFLSLNCLNCWACYSYCCLRNWACCKNCCCFQNSWKKALCKSLYCLNLAWYRKNYRSWLWYLSSLILNKSSGSGLWSLYFQKSTLTWE